MYPSLVRMNDRGCSTAQSWKGFILVVPHRTRTADAGDQPLRPGVASSGRIAIRWIRVAGWV